MKLTCHRDELSRGLAIVDGAVARTSTLSVLSHVLLAANGGRLKLAATNLELGINCWIGAKVEEEGSTTVPAKLLSQFIKNLPSEPVSIELQEKTQTLHLQCAGQKAKILGIAAAEFPIVAVPENAQAVTVYAQLLREMIGQVAYAAAADDSRPTLTGIYTTISSGGLTMVTADGYRLAKRAAAIQPAPPITASAIIPAAAMREVAKVIGSADCAVKLTFEEGRVFFSLPGVEVIAQLLDGNYPDCNRLIPKAQGIHVRVDGKALQQAMQTASLFANPKTHLVRFTASHSQIMISATSAEFGSNENLLDCALEGASIEIGLSCKYVGDALAVMPAGEVIIGINSPHEPITIRPADGIDLLAEVMPIHLERQ